MKFPRKPTSYGWRHVDVAPAYRGLWRDLALIIPLGLNTGTAWALSRQGVISATNEGTGWYLRDTILGPGTAYGGNGFYFTMGQAPMAIEGKWTIAGLKRHTTSFYAERLVAEFASSSAPVCGLYVDDTGVVGTYGAATVTSAAGVADDNGDVYLLGGSNDGTTSRVWSDGVEVASGASTETANSANTRIYIGKDYYTGQQNWECTDLLILIWARVLDAAEWRILAADPWGVVRPQIRRAVYAPAGGVAVDVVATARAFSRAFAALPLDRSLAAHARGQARGAAALLAARAAVPTGRGQSRANGALPTSRSITASDAARSAVHAHVIRTAALHASARSAASATAQPIASRAVVASDRSQSTGQATAHRAVALAALDRATARVRAAALRQTMLVASARAASTMHAPAQLSRDVRALARATSRIQAPLIRVVALQALARVHARADAAATRQAALVAVARATSRGAVDYAAGLVLLVATGYARSRAGSAATLMRDIQSMARSAGRSDAAAVRTLAIQASALAISQARGALIRAVLLSAVARSAGRGATALPMVRALLMTAETRARVAASLDAATIVPAAPAYRARPEITRYRAALQSDIYQAVRQERYPVPHHATYYRSQMRAHVYEAD